MADPRFQSVHLGSTDRRSEFRSARARIFSACGEQTLAGGGIAAPAHTPTAEQGMTREGPTAADQGPAHYFLQCTDGVFALKLGLNSIGRLSDNDITIPNASISRRHCTVIVHSNHHCEVVDTASKNGTYLNRRRLTEAAVLVPGDELLLCDYRIKFVVSSGETPSALKPGDGDGDGGTDLTYVES